MFRRGDEVFLPLQSAILEGNPTIFTPAYYDTEVIILIESNYYEGQMTFHPYSDYWTKHPGNISFEMTFNLINYEK